jgi:16S rRNA (adenine1518-N6/adenine1519-N6)-dimethyltransferase
MKRVRFGQHFLTDTNIAYREIEYADLQPDETVLEIGPGHGVLTKILAKKAAHVIAIELDTKLVDELQNTMPKNVQIVQGDACKLDFTEIPRFTKIVANLPFQISSEITFKLLSYQFDKAVMMYQKDFANRMVAQQGTKIYGRLSVGVFYKTLCRILERVPRNCFSPRPQIDACIVELLPRQKPPFKVTDESYFFEVTKQLFLHRRKMIGTTISLSFNIKGNVPFADMRVEQLSPAEIGLLSNFVYNALEEDM